MKTVILILLMSLPDTTVLGPWVEDTTKPHKVRYSGWKKRKGRYVQYRIVYRKEYRQAKPTQQ